MKIIMDVCEPYKTKGGKWDVRLYQREEEIPDENLDRHSLMCAYCGFPSYPKCREICKAGDPQPSLKGKAD